MFHIGQRVICVEDLDRFRDRREFYGRIEIYPKKGEKYTVRESIVDRDHDQVILLQEIRNLKLNYSTCYGEVWFWSEFFRPIIERDTSIEVFEQILNGVNVRRPETVD